MGILIGKIYWIFFCYSYFITSISTIIKYLYCAVSFNVNNTYL